VTAIAARQGEIGEEARDALVEHGAIVAAGLVAERGGEPALADAGGTADQEIVAIVGLIILMPLSRAPAIRLSQQGGETIAAIILGVTAGRRAPQLLDRTIGNPIGHPRRSDPPPELSPLPDDGLGEAAASNRPGSSFAMSPGSEIVVALKLGVRHDIFVAQGVRPGCGLLAFLGRGALGGFHALHLLIGCRGWAQYRLRISVGRQLWPRRCIELW
jgi:hypothetical protein